MNIESAKIAIDKMASFLPEHILNDVYKDHDATAEVLAQDENRVVFSIVYHDKTDKRILSVTVKRHSVDVHYNGNMQVFSHRIDESFFNDVVNVLSDVQPNQDAESDNMKQNKYVYLNVLQGNYGFGYEDLTASESYAEVKKDLKAYRQNDPRSYRIIKRREVNPAN